MRTVNDKFKTHSCQAERMKTETNNTLPTNDINAIFFISLGVPRSSRTTKDRDSRRKKLPLDFRGKYQEKVWQFLTFIQAENQLNFTLYILGVTI